VRGIAEVVRARQAGARVLVGHDTRLLGPRLAAEAAEVLAGAGLRPLAVPGPTATPVLAHAVVREGAAAGLVFTASHNPPEYQGLKWLTAEGAAATGELTREAEHRASAWLAGSPPRGGRPAVIEVGRAYRRELAALLDRGRLRRSGLRVIYDALHGTGAGELDAVLRACGVAVRTRRVGRDPGFGGGAPDPTRERLRGLGRELRREPRPCLGLATDGDADRFAVLDASGRMLDAAEALALLVDHLAHSRRVSRGIALTVATGSLPERVARWHGLAVERHPVGFKHLCDALRAGRAELAGDESGGFAWARFGLDKDGILAGCLVAELAAGLEAPLARRLARLRRRLGPGVFGQGALAAAPAARAALARLERDPPARLLGARVQGVERVDGLRLLFADGFVLWRASGTEPLLRVYAEAPDARRLRQRLAAAARLVAKRGR
jgi:phosphomannomutase